MISLGIYNVEPVIIIDINGNPLGSSSAPLLVASQSTQILSSGTYTRPATTPTYSVGQGVLNNGTGASATPLHWSGAGRSGNPGGFITGVILQTSNQTITNGSFILKLYSASPTYTNGDAATWSQSQSLNKLGEISVTLSDVNSDGGVGIGIAGGGILFSGTDIYGTLVAGLTGYVGASAQTFVAKLQILTN